MKKSIIALTTFFCLLILFSILFAFRQNNKQVKLHPNSKYTRIVVCYKALEALGRIGDPRMKAVVTSGFKDRESLIRVAAAEALSKLGDKKTIPLLEGSLADESYLVRILVTKALLKLGQPGMEKKLLDFLNSDEASVRAVVVEQLGQFKDRYLPRLVEILATDNSDLVRLRAIQQLGINKFSSAVPLIQQALNDHNSMIRQAACIALGRIGDYKAFHLLIERLTDKETIVRAAAKVGLSMLEDSTAITEGENGLIILFRKDLDNKNSELRMSSFIGLANLNDLTILPRLLKEVVFPGNPTWAKMMAARSLRILKPDLADFFDRLTKSSVLSSANLELSYKVDGKNLLSLVINALEDGANPLHSDSVFILGELKDNACLPALRRALSQDDSDIVANASYVLGLLQDKEAVPYLINVCKNYGL